MTNLLFGLIAAAAGVATAVQAAANAGLAARIGLAAALVTNTSIVLLGTLALYGARGPEGTFFPSDAPWSLYVGGLCGFVVLLSLTFVFPKIGAAVAIALGRVAGLCLVGGGIALIRA